MILILTGTPGTGKTTIAKILCKKLGLKYVDGKKVIEKKSLREGYDKELEAIIVDEKKLSEEFEKEKNAVIDSHLAYFMKPKKVDLCVVLRCDAKELIRRLKKRKYNEEKIKENVQAEIMNVCGNDAFERGHTVLEINTTRRNANNIVKLILEKISALQNHWKNGVKQC
jgi:adenylate kinase